MPSWSFETSTAERLLLKSYCYAFDGLLAILHLWEVNQQPCGGSVWIDLKQAVCAGLISPDTLIGGIHLDEEHDQEAK